MRRTCQRHARGVSQSSVLRYILDSNGHIILNFIFYITHEIRLLISQFTMEYAALNLTDQPTHPSDKPTPSTDDKGLPGSDPLTTSSQTCLVPPQLDGTYNKTFGTALLSPKTSLELFSTLTEEQLKHESAYHSTFCGTPDLTIGEGMLTRK